ncbi:hypothetical protein EV696_105156 [Permianibacter aggregans]|uniref:Uncharacterized protein n=2 Tax=Permianibacter aggregans TaxID=1510150 RepID=A0A4R6UQG2_9GAMM|nr:hypothetical protein EV696_105156 [Permianibacter aggregans]
MWRALLITLLALPLVAEAGKQCGNDQQLDPRVLMDNFLKQELVGQRPEQLISWENFKPAYKGSEYVYPINTPNLSADSMTVVKAWKLEKIEMRGNEAIARVEMFTLADVWRPKGTENDKFGRRVTEIGETFVEKYRMRKVDNCWYVIDPPKPVISFDTVLTSLESDLSEIKSLTWENITDEDRKAKSVLEKEVSLLIRLKNRYLGGV